LLSLTKTKTKTKTKQKQKELTTTRWVVPPPLQHANTLTQHTQPFNLLEFPNNMKNTSGDMFSLPANFGSPLSGAATTTTTGGWEPEFPILSTSSSSYSSTAPSSSTSDSGVVVICPFCSIEVSIPNQATAAGLGGIAGTGFGGVGRKRTISVQKKHQDQSVIEDALSGVGGTGTGATELLAQLSHVQLGLFNHLESCLIEGEVAVTNPPPLSIHFSLPLLPLTRTASSFGRNHGVNSATTVRN